MALTAPYATNPHCRKLCATITLIREDRGYAMATDAAGHEFFVFYNAIEMMGEYGFEDLRIGSTIKLTPIEHPKGLRGIEVEIVAL